MSDTTTQPPSAQAAGSGAYLNTWTIVVQADSQQGAMDAVFWCWKAWQEGAEPVGGSCPGSMGNRMKYHVEKTTSPSGEGADQ